MIRLHGKSLLPLWGYPVRLASALAVSAYVRTAYRIRGWGDLPRYDGAALVISNHQTDRDLMAIISAMALQKGWRSPLFSAAARMLFEPGFLGMRVPWLAGVLHDANLG